MVTESPLSSRNEHYRERDIALSIPDGFDNAGLKQHKQATESLQQSWAKAVTRFKEATGKDLGNYRQVGKDGVLNNLQQRYGGDSKDGKKRDELFGTMEKVLNGVELVAATAAQAASVVFGPAQMCFNAVDILLSIPRELKKYAEDLQSLFSEIASYLENFKVFDRIDQRGMLDIALLKSNNEILINLVDSDAIKGALSAFQDLIEKQNKLTSTIILEATLESKDGIRQVIRGTARAQETNKDTNVMVTALAADSTESKNLKVDKDRITKIDKALELSENMVIRPLEDLSRASHTDLGSTIALLKDKDSYKQWSTLEPGRKVLYISGGSGSGKTNVLSALAGQIENDKRRLLAQQSEDLKNKQLKSDRAIYLTHFSFSEIVKGTDRGKYETPVHHAFKVIASQLARQSTRYASALAAVETFEKLQKGQKTLKQLWDDLKLTDLASIAPAHSILYVLFDGLDELKDSLKDLSSVVKVSTTKESSKISEETLVLRVIFTGSAETEEKLDSVSPKINMTGINMSEINMTLIRDYVHAQMQIGNILQDDDEESRKIRAKVLEAIPASSNGSFDVARVKLRTVTEAIEEDIDPDVLIQKLQITTSEDEGKKILDGLKLKLSQQHKEQLRELLVWTVYAKQRPELNQLESALYLQRDKKSLEPLRQKIERRFDEAFTVRDSYVSPKYAIEDVIRLPLDRSLVDITTLQNSRSKQNPSSDDQDQTQIDILLSYLRNRPLNEDHDPQNQSGEASSEDKLSPNERFAEFTILSRVFRALNDDRVRQQASALIVYAMINLPSHLEGFAESMDAASNEELRIVGKGLVNFLRDSESIQAACASLLPSITDWLSLSSVKAMKSILASSRVQEQLEHIERRWARNNTAKDSGRASFLETLATTVARCWLTDHGYRISSWGCYCFMSAYLDMLTLPEPQTFDDDDIDSNEANEIAPAQLQAENSNLATAGEVELTPGSADDVPPTKNEKTPEPILGKFSHSSIDIELKRTTLFALCLDIKGEHNEASLNLNDCISSDSGQLRWKRNGKAFQNSLGSRLTENGTVFEMLLYDKNRQVRRRLLLDEQISNEDGRLTFLDTAITEDDAANTHDEVEEVDFSASSIASIKRVEQWALKILKRDLDPFARERIGMTFLDAGEGDTAIEYFQNAASETMTPQNAIGLARAFAAKAQVWGTSEAETKDNWNKAIESIQKALDIFRNEASVEKTLDTTGEQENEPPNDAEVYDLFTCLLRAAEYQKLRNEQAAAVDLMEEALTGRPTASECRWELMELLCRVDRHTRAQELFEEWNSIPDTPKGETRSGFLRRYLTSDKLHRKFLPVVKLMRGATVHNRIRETIAQAIKDEDELQEPTDEIWFRYAHGLMLAAEGGEANLNDAEIYWIEAFNTGCRLTFDDDLPLEWSSKLTCMNYFDRARKEFLQSPDMSSQASIALLDNVARRITELLPPRSKDYPEAERVTGYVASLGRVTGQLEYSKRYLTEDMTSAIDILSDDDIWNDDTGIQRLFQVLLRYGDYEGALTAWSLLDRDETRVTANKIRLERDGKSTQLKEETDGQPLEDDSQRGADNPLNAATSLEDKDKKKEDKNDSKEDKDEDEEAEDEKAEDEEGEVEEEEEADENDGVFKYYVVSCDNCSAILYSCYEGSEMWWCKYCPFVAFCTLCKKKLNEGMLESCRCNPEHPLLLVKHFEYEVEELKESNVLIEWKLTSVEVEEEQNGETKKITKRIREGGRIVQLNEWLDVLRRDWNTTKTSTGWYSTAMITGYFIACVGE